MTDTTSNQSEPEIDDTSAAYCRIGQQLRQERQRQGLSAEHVSRHLHLSGLLLDDLEQGRVERMASIYRRGYISNYARLLGLDANTLLSELEPDSMPELQEVMPGNPRARRFDRYLRIGTYLIVTFVIIPPLAMLYWQSGSRMVDREPAATEQVVRADSAPEAGQTAPGDAAEAAEAATAGEKRRQSGSHVSASALPLAAIRPLREVEAEEAEQAESELAPPAPEPLSPESMGEVESELRLSLVEDSWIEVVSADGERLEYDLLRAGQERSYRGQAPFRVLLGRANAVELYMDGQALDFAGDDRGDVAEIMVLASGDVER